MMSKEKRRVPKLRFPGFTEDWEQRKFKDIAFKRGKISEADLPYVEFEDINSGIGTLNKNISQKVGHKKGLLFEAGDVLFGKLRPYLQNWLLCQFAGIAVGDFWVLQPQNVSSAFLYYLIQSEAYQSVANISSGTKMPRSSWPLVSETLFSIPKYKEANMIGEFFLLIDRTITLHQRKLNNLKLKKKALLQKLFPKNEERYPELRFPGFTDAWEQCKLSVLATMNARIGWQNLRTSEFLDNGDYLLITGTDFDNGRIKYSTCHYVEKKRFDQDTKIQLSTGSILITKDGTLGKVALVEELPKPATINAGVFNVRVKDDAFLSYKYLYHYLKAPFLMKYVTANATGGTIKHLNQSILVDFPIPITGKQEQDRIAKLLDSLESIITLHQRKLDHLQLQKKALLQQMFV